MYQPVLAVLPLWCLFPRWSSHCCGLFEGGITKALIFREKQEILLWLSSSWLRCSTASPLKLWNCSHWNSSWHFTLLSALQRAYKLKCTHRAFPPSWYRRTQDPIFFSPLFPDYPVGHRANQGIQTFRVQPIVFAAVFSSLLLPCHQEHSPKGPHLPSPSRTAGRGEETQKWGLRGQEGFWKQWVWDG